MIFKDHIRERTKNSLYSMSGGIHDDIHTKKWYQAIWPLFIRDSYLFIFLDYFSFRIFFFTKKF